MLSEEVVDEEVYAQGDEPAEEYFECDVLDVPPYAYVFGFHECVACRVAYGEQTSAYAATQGDEVPVLSVFDETLQVGGHAWRVVWEDGVDGDAADDKGEVVHDGTDESEYERHDIDVVDVLVAPVAYAVHGTYFDEDVYAESYAEEEHYHLHAFVLQAAVCLSAERLVGKDAFAVDDFVCYPKNAEHAECTEEWWQACESVECRYEP